MTRISGTRSSCAFAIVATPNNVSVGMLPAVLPLGSAMVLVLPKRFYTGMQARQPTRAKTYQAHKLLLSSLVFGADIRFLFYCAARAAGTKLMQHIRLRLATATNISVEGYYIPVLFLLGCRPASALASTHNICSPAPHGPQEKTRPPLR